MLKLLLWMLLLMVFVVAFTAATLSHTNNTHIFDFYSEASRKINKNCNIFAKRRKFSEKGFHSSYHFIFLSLGSYKYNKHTHYTLYLLCCCAWIGIEIETRTHRHDVTLFFISVYLINDNFFSVQYFYFLFYFPSSFDLLGQAHHHHVRPLHIFQQPKKCVSKKAHVLW